MTRRILLVAILLLLLLPACRDDRKRPDLTAEEEAILKEKADEKIGLIIRENLPALFAGIVVFRSDAFLTQSEMLSRRELSVLDSFGNAAVVLLNSPDIPPLLKEKSVRKISYLCRQGPLARIHPAFLMEVLNRFGEGKETVPTSFLVRFREMPQEKEEKFVEAAGFTVASRAGVVWAVSGPLTSLPRLLEDDRI
ncbi:MAG TPA: hypothetical protein VJ307_05170, partial [Candidatus Deferrimicrobiaceae bacterium]|nr:hypothetical protein [Candidatus Deferrimicrobiaceae bacterium]